MLLRTLLLQVDRLVTYYQNYKNNIINFPSPLLTPADAMFTRRGRSSTVCWERRRLSGGTTVREGKECDSDPCFWKGLTFRQFLCGVSSLPTQGRGGIAKRCKEHGITHGIIPDGRRGGHIDVASTQVWLQRSAGGLGRSTFLVSALLSWPIARACSPHRPILGEPVDDPVPLLVAGDQPCCFQD